MHSWPQNSKNKIKDICPHFQTSSLRPLSRLNPTYIWAPSSEFVSSSIPSWQISTAHAQPFRGARDLAFCLKVPLDSLLVWSSSEGSGETARMRRLAWTFAARIGDKYQIRLTRSIWRHSLYGSGEERLWSRVRLTSSCQQGCFIPTLALRTFNTADEYWMRISASDYVNKLILST